MQRHFKGRFFEWKSGEDKKSWKKEYLEKGIQELRDLIDDLKKSGK